MTGRARVGVNLLWLVPGVVGGSEEYATRLLRAMADRLPADLQMVLFTLPAFARVHGDLASAFEHRILHLRGRAKPARVAAESLWLANQVRRRDVALVHHLGGRIPARSPVPAVVTVHDLQPLEHPENFSLVKRMFLGRAVPRSARRARLVTTPSDQVRQRIVERFGVPTDRVVAVPAPVEVRHEPAVRPSAVPAGLAALIDTRTPFFVYPAITYRHKNHRVLLEAFAGLRQVRPEVRLVLTGGVGDAEDEVRHQINALGIGDAVLRAGRVDRAVLDLLLDHAVAVVFPSYYEGFGLPVLEAMSVGCPVIAADATALPEVVGDAGVLVDPDDPTAWSAAMAHQLSASRVEAAAAGRAQAEHYTPEWCAARLLAVYRAALEGRAWHECREG